jgi:hypothetical protein
MTFRLTPGIRSWMLGMVVLVASTCSDGAAQEGATDPKSSPQAVTFSDLEGAKIHAKLVTEMMTRREGRQGPATQETDWQIYVEPGGRISFSFRPTTHTPRGTRAGQIRATTAKLDDPWYTENGQAVWQFKDGELTFVRTYTDGAVRTIIALKQDGQNLTCAATSAYARERGKGGLVLNSPIDGVPVTILSWKQVSSSCQVTR